MIAADSVIAAATLILVYLYSMDAVSVWIIYILLFIRSVGGSLHRPAMNASTSLMIPEEHFTRIQSINQMLNGRFSIIAAPFGALLLDVSVMPGIVLIDVVTAFIAILPLLFFDVPQTKAAPTEASKKNGGQRNLRFGMISA